MRVLITGAGGFVGQHLIQHLLETVPEAEIHGTFLNPVENINGIQCHSLNLVDEQAVMNVIEQIQPAQIYHLAGQAFVPRSFEDPWETMENNIRPQLNLIQSCLKLNIKPRMITVSSAEIYGAASTMPITEATQLQPSSPYSVSKVAQDLLGLQYYLSHQLPIMRARAFNHIGTGQNDRFVAPAFAMQIARIEAGLQEAVIKVGDLSARRDFTDVRDIVRAYHLIIEKGSPGEAYNVASGETHNAQELLDILLSYTTIKIKIVVDASRLRQNYIPILQGDNTRLRNATGWQPLISFHQTLHDVLEDCRERVRKQGA